ARRQRRRPTPPEPCNGAHRSANAPDGRVDRRGHGLEVAEEGRGRGGQGRAAPRDLDRQGGRGDPLACGGRARGDQGGGRRDGRGRQRTRLHRDGEGRGPGGGAARGRGAGAGRNGAGR